ncbi:MAG: PTS transporter subunit EIIB [Brevinema sp.]
MYCKKIISFFKNCCKKKSKPCCCSTNTEAETLLELLGGKDNIKHLDACLTRLRLELNDLSKISKAELNKCTSTVIEVPNGVQLVLGAKTQSLKEEMEKLLKL